MANPLLFIWQGDGFSPIKRHAKECDQRYVIGQAYALDEIQERSQTSHNHEFAWLADAWKNLPEKFDHEPWAQSPEHLRKYGLIRCKFCTTETFPCGSNAEALRWASRLRADDEYCIITVDGSIVHRFRAESQSRRAMGAKRFQASKSALMEFVSDLIGVTTTELAS